MFTSRRKHQEFLLVWHAHSLTALLMLLGIDWFEKKKKNTIFIRNSQVFSFTVAAECIWQMIVLTEIGERNQEHFAFAEKVMLWG